MTADLARIEELIGRVEAASGPDRALDRDIAVATGVLHVDASREEGRQLYRIENDGSWTFGGLGDNILIRPVTASVDAALALIERGLPGWSWCIDCDGCVLARVAPPEIALNGANIIEAEGKTPALALVLALLKALKERQG